jgi:acetyl-CoA carboxylase carboxyltransferase component
MVIAYDYTVFAGTQGMINHKKQDRLFQIAKERRLPLVLFAEGGGGRPGDTDFQLRPMLDLHTFRTFAELSGQAPLVGIVSGRCFAGNAVLLGCCDVIIATEDSNIGLAGPVMIEGAGLGSFAPEAIGPIDVQTQNGVVDVRVKDEASAVAVAKRYMSYFQGSTSEWQEPDVVRLRSVVPENRMRVYEMRSVIAGFADVDSVLELRREFGVGMITALIRIEGRPCGVIANEPTHLAGAIDAEAGDKAARFMRLCNAFGMPIISLCDTPGFMVGPEAEKTALVRRVTRMLVTACQLDVPLLTVVVRKGYGLGAMAMAGGSLHSPFMTLAWPSGELGAMGLEGAVLLGIKKQLAAIEDPTEREKTVRSVVNLLREQGKAINVATHLEIDDVIDPADTRACLAKALVAAGPTDPRSTKNPRAFIDTW